ncbi:MAG: TerB family tellurite resistance protein [Flavobacteriaceae bacterium]|nr:TerB family tellurite resistance protein [Bacteroidia bacterium]NNK83839.1 TerB family tellurite resistance protein [Flavobacteriaceae bacterium]
MMNRVEKLSLLSEMIAFARVDNSLKEIEYNFLLGVAKQLHITQEDFDYLLDNPISHVKLKSYSERIVQFHRLVLLMIIDDEITSKEMYKLHNFGLKMGLNYDAINRVLELMESFPNKVIPPDFLIDIFKVQYN